MSNLKKSAEETKKVIEEQIKKGQEIQVNIAYTLPSIRANSLEIGQWNMVNECLLNDWFENSKKDDYSKRTTIAEINGNSSIYQDVSYLKDSIELKINYLKGVLAQIPLMTSAPDSNSDEVMLILNRVRACAKQHRTFITDEKTLQSFMYGILRSHFDDLKDEEPLAKYGMINFKPDFVIPSLATIIEAKYINEKTDPKRIQEQIQTDIDAYLRSNSTIKTIYFYVWDAANKMEDIKKLSNLERDNVKIIIEPGLG